MIYLLMNLIPLLKYKDTHWMHLGATHQTKENIVSILETKHISYDAKHSPNHVMNLTPIVKVLDAKDITLFCELLGVPINAVVGEFDVQECDRFIVPGSNLMDLDKMSSEGWTEVTVISMHLLGEDGMITEEDVNLFVKEIDAATEENKKD
jgi:hypothetical protein